LGQIERSVNRRKLYYLSQIVGWSLYIVIAGLLNLLFGVPITTDLIISLYTALVVGLFSSHLYRETIVRLGWLKLSIEKLIPRVLGGSVFFAFLFHVLYSLLNSILVFNKVTILWEDSNIITWIMLFFVWSLFYFIFHFFQNYRKEEIKNLRWQAQRNEFELKRLKSQMNPHFIFNAMNTIRALVEEDPEMAKQSITRLSNILRNSLLLGKNKEIAFAEEINLVRDYLAIEKARYEERLTVEWDLDANSKHYRIPPLMLQTLVENGIKHGISNLTKGGFIRIISTVENGNLRIAIENSGQLVANTAKPKGFGLVNTKERLRLLYGDKSRFDIRNKNDHEVITEVIIPPPKTLKQ